MEPLSALRMSSILLGVAGMLFQLRMMCTAGTDYEDLAKVLNSEIKQQTKRKSHLLAFSILVIFVPVIQTIGMLVSWWVYPFWNQSLHLLPITAWLAFFAGLRALFIHRQYLDGFQLIETRYLSALVIANLVLSVAITYFYTIII